MRIVFVRHGKPDYKTDSLTELGWIQARATAKKLLAEGISEIYASSMGRAKQTAEAFSEASGLAVTPLDFMREITWGSEVDGEELPFGGHPWLLLPEYVKAGKSLSLPDWTKDEVFAKNIKLQKSTERVILGFDAWLSGFGFEREGDFYRVTRDDTDKTIALFSHGGASTAVFSHIFNIPFLSACLFVRPYFCSVGIIKIDGKLGELTIPKIEILNDDRHVPKASDEARIDN